MYLPIYFADHEIIKTSTWLSLIKHDQHLLVKFGVQTNAIYVLHR